MMRPSFVDARRGGLPDGALTRSMGLSRPVMA